MSVFWMTSGWCCKMSLCASCQAFPLPPYPVVCVGCDAPLCLTCTVARDWECGALCNACAATNEQQLAITAAGKSAVKEEEKETTQDYRWCDICHRVEEVDDSRCQFQDCGKPPCQRTPVFDRTTVCHAHVSVCMQCHADYPMTERRYVWMRTHSEGIGMCNTCFARVQSIILWLLRWRRCNWRAGRGWIQDDVIELVLREFMLVVPAHKRLCSRTRYPPMQWK